MQFGWRTFEDFFGNPEPVSLQNQFPSNHCMHNLMLYLPTLPTHSCGVHYSYLIITSDTCHPRWTFTVIWQLSQTDLANVFAKYSPLHGLTLPSKFHCLIAWPSLPRLLLTVTPGHFALCSPQHQCLPITLATSPGCCELLYLGFTCRILVL